MGFLESNWPRRALAIGALAVAGLAAGTAPASAKTYCVNLVGCTPADTFDDDLQGALTAAGIDNSAPRDTIRIGPVTLDDGPYLTSAAVDIVGAGVGSTVLTKPSGSGFAVLELTGEANETVSKLAIHPTAATGSTVPQGLIIYGGTAEEVEISAPGPLNALTIGAVLGNGATLRRSSVAVARTDDSIAVSMNGGATVEQTTLSGSTGLFSGVSGAPPPQSTNVGRYLRIMARHPAAAEGSTLRLQSSLLKAPGPFSLALWAKGDEGQNESAAIEATNVTVIGDGSAGGVGIRAEAVRNEFPRHADAAVVLRNSVLLDFATPIVRSGESASLGFNAGVANVGVVNSLFDQTVAPVASGPGAVASVGSVGPFDPRFVSDGDFHLLADSPLIDAGDPAGLPAADLDGGPRVLDGDGDGVAAPDIGAFEHPAPVAPSSPPAPGNPPVSAADTIPPRLSKLSLSHTRFRVGAKSSVPQASRAPSGSTFRFTISERASVTIGFERAASGHRLGGRCQATDQANRGARRCIRWVGVGGRLDRDDLAAGAQAVAFSGRIGRHSFAVGRYRATLIAADPAGNRSRPRLVGFWIVP
jgi:hypothetical protein